jgi:tRNA threonylcarbamoyladenosine biosynthesis protein TsaE
MQQIFNEVKLNDLPIIAKEIIESYKNDRIFTFFGKMGAGKTTLIKEICNYLKVVDVVCSPTFSIVNEYHTSDNESVFHFDFYRIKNEKEAYDIGYEDYFYSNNYCLIEWPEKISELLPENYVKVLIEENDTPDFRNIVCEKK